MKGVNKENIKKHALNEFLSEYKELNTDNKYRPVAVGRYGIRKRESIYSKELAKDYSKNKLIHKDTLTVGMGSKQIDIGILIEDETFAVSPAYHTYKIQGIRCKYLEYCLQSKNIEMFSLYAKRGSRQGKSIDLKRWLTYKIPVYSEEDQIVIEENLNKINVVIELRRKQLELLDELVRARFVEMFGDPVTNPKGWETTSIGDECYYIKDGPHKSLPDIGRDNGGHPFISVRNIVNGYIDFSDARYISDEDYYDSIKKCHPEKGDMLYSKGGTTGIAKLIDIDEPFANWVHVAVLKFDKFRLNGIFFENMLNGDYCYSQSQRLTKGIANRDLVLSAMAQIKLYCPPLELQNQFASFVQEIDKSRSRIQKSLEASQELFDSLMQEYFG